MNKKVTIDALIYPECFLDGEPEILGDSTIDDFGVSDEDVMHYQGYLE